MEKEKRNTGPVLIILAGCFWGSMGIFVRKLSACGFTSVQIVSIRVTLAALAFSALLFFKDRSGFRPAARDLPLFFGLGFGSILFFTVCYFTAIEMMTLSAAAILLYTSPIWIMLMSAVFFREKLTRKKLLGSGIGYGLYSILGTVALRRYSPYTVTTWTFLLAATGSWLICRPADMIAKFAAAGDRGALAGLCVLTALVTAVIPFLAYTLGLRTVEAGKAGILATVEPMVATLIGITVFSEPLTVFSGAGILLILAAVVVLNRKREE